MARDKINYIVGDIFSQNIQQKGPQFYFKEDNNGPPLKKPLSQLILEI